VYIRLHLPTQLDDVAWCGWKPQRLECADDVDAAATCNSRLLLLRRHDEHNKNNRSLCVWKRETWHFVQLFYSRPVTPTEAIVTAQVLVEYLSAVTTPRTNRKPSNAIHDCNAYDGHDDLSPFWHRPITLLYHGLKLFPTAATKSMITTWFWIVWIVFKNSRIF